MSREIPVKRICASAELVDGGRGVRFELDPKAYFAPVAFVVRHCGAVRAYVNHCPHAGTELDWNPGEFFDETGLYLICSTHGALFEPGKVRRQAPTGAASHTVFRVGEVHGLPTERARRVAELLSVVDGSKVTSNLWGERWSKLCHNAMRNGVSAATGLAGREIDQHEDIRHFTNNDVKFLKQF